MSDSAVLLQPAFILRHINYRESSLILDALTHDYGVVSVIAKGVRKKKSTMAGVLLPFSSLKLSFYGQSDLKLLTGAELVTLNPLTGLALFCGFYVNELVYHFLHKNDPYPEVFKLYQQCLQQLRNAEHIEQTLRMFELKLLEYAGYAVSLGIDGADGSPVVKNKRYKYLPAVGVVSSENGYVSGNTLAQLQHGTLTSKDGLAEAKQLMRAVLDDHLQGKALKSRTVLASIIRFLQ